MDEYVTELGVRFRDIDAMRHVNNAVYATYLEQARAEYFRDVVGFELDEVDTVLASLHVEYRQPIELDETVEVGLTVPELGNSSIRMEYEIRTENGVAAEAETVQVAFDPDVGASRPIPGEWRTAIAAFHGIEPDPER